jgi:hypothetical protein
MYKMDQKTVSLCERVIEEYEPMLADGKSFPGLVELAYWSAQNIIGVGECLKALGSEMPQEKKDGFYGQALSSHHRRALAYWKSIAYFHESNYWNAVDNKALESEVERLQELRRTSNIKLLRLEGHFPEFGSRLTFDAKEISLGPFNEMLEIYPKGRNQDDGVDVQFAELVYWSAENTLAVSSCLDASIGNFPQGVRDKLYSEAFKSHGGRALAYWEAVHYFNLQNYAELPKKSSQAIRDEHFRRVQMSHRKMAKATARYDGYTSDENLDRDLLDRHIHGEGIKLA